MINVNDLIGLRHQWAKRPGDGSGCTDCFALCMEVRQRLGLKSFMADYEWVYQYYQPGEISNRQIISWIWRNSEKIKEPRPGAVFYVPSGGKLLALAVVVDGKDCLFLSPGKQVVRMPFATVAKGKFYWAE